MRFSNVLLLPLVKGLKSSGQGRDQFPFPYEADSPTPFKLELDDSFLDATIRKVKDYRPTVGLSEDWNNEGPPEDRMSAVAKYWSDKYDWSEVESRLNKDFEHYATTVHGNDGYNESIPLHFVHHRSEDDNAIPLLLLHGWPSTFLEWAKVIKPLTESNSQPFHVVAPDLPGFGFSPAPVQPGLGPREMGKAFDDLMHQLGYDKYGLVTTDLGWFTGMWMVGDAKDSIIGHISDFFAAKPTDDDLERFKKNETTEEETSYMKAVQAWQGDHLGYSDIHGQKPLALGAALADSPVGLLGWYWDVNHATSDGYEYSHEELITDAMMLYIPGPYANIRAYLEVFNPKATQFPKTDVPTGLTQWGWGNGPFPELGDFAFAPVDWVERAVNLVFFKRHDRGGHFPAISQPKLWTEDVVDFFSGLNDSIVA